MISKTTSQMRTDATELFLHGIEAVDAYTTTKRNLKIDGGTLIASDVLGCSLQLDLAQFKRTLLVGFGKASAAMARASDDILQGRIQDGVVIVKKIHGRPPKKIAVIEAGHPLPDARSIEGAKRIAELASSANEHDLVICLISGGGSALCTLPRDGIALADLQQITLHLMNSGASIKEINTVRKHLSQIKGGQLAKLTHPATMLSLIISDVVGDPPDVIASGPTAPDPTTFRDAQKVLEKYQLQHNIPVAIREHLKQGFAGRQQETPKESDRAFRKTSNLIIANNLTALRSIAEKAAKKGYTPFILSSMIQGDTRHAAQVFANIVRELITRPATGTPLCIITGGETTVRVSGPGKGGRNTDFCLALAPMIKGFENVVILSAGTDGIDGMTDAAGAIVDGVTSRQAVEQGLDIELALRENDSYTLLKKLNRLLVTGPTETNVMDIQMVMVG